MKQKESKKIKGTKDSPKKQQKNSNALFDENGRLISVEKETVEKEPQNIQSNEEEKKEKQRQRWRDYYHKNKDKYKQWNKRWREKQKAKSQKKKE